MKVAVTGATGFIGRHVIAELARRSIDPILVCRPTTKISAAFSKYTTVRTDIANPPSNLFELMHRPDVLIHLAWGGLPNYHSLHHFECELPQHYRFLKQMVESGLENLLVTGTCLEYGLQSGPLTESCVARPTVPYGFAKDMLRRQLEFLKQAMPFNLTWCRLFYVYGEGQAQTSLLAQLKKAVEAGDRVFNMSKGDQLRDYLPVAEMSEYLISLGLIRQDNGIVNVCSGIPLSVRDLVERWLRENSWAIELNRGYYPYPSYEPIAFWGDRSKLDRCLNPS